MKCHYGVGTGPRPQCPITSRQPLTPRDIDDARGEFKDRLYCFKTQREAISEASLGHLSVKRREELSAQQRCFNLCPHIRKCQDGSFDTLNIEDMHP